MVRFFRGDAVPNLSGMGDGKENGRKSKSTHESRIENMM